MVIGALVRKIRGMLDEFEANRIVMKALDIPRTELIIKNKEEAPKEGAERAIKMAERRISGEPLQYILGETEFMSLRFKVNRSTLIPRCDTETLVEYLLEFMDGKPANILDIGTGTGCIAISLARYNKNVSATGLDISGEALRTALENARLNGVADRVSFAEMNILDETPSGIYDIVVSNPPYIETDVIDSLQTEVKDYEPLSALDGGSDGLKFYRRIVGQAMGLLRGGGMLAFETGFDQGEAVSELMKNAGFEDVKIIKDLCGNDRVVAGKKHRNP